MSLFICEDCFCVENTALGMWWSRNDVGIWAPEHVGKARCSACAPATYRDGGATGYGAWHRRFSKDLATEADRSRVNNPEVLDRMKEPG